jgi:hypothetical protein
MFMPASHTASRISLNQATSEYHMNATQMPARLTAEDRAFMLYVARRDYQRGKSA